MIWKCLNSNTLDVTVIKFVDFRYTNVNKLHFITTQEETIKKKHTLNTNGYPFVPFTGFTQRNILNNTI